MKFLYKVRFEDGSEKNIVSDMNNMYNVVNRIQIVTGKKITAIRMAGEIEIVNEYDGNPITNLKAEVNHHVGRIEEALGIYNPRYEDVKVEIEAIRDLIKE